MGVVVDRRRLRDTAYRFFAAMMRERVTARDAVRDRITGLDSDADDYVVKPTDLNELAARLRALVRRPKASPRRFCLHQSQAV